MAENRGDDGPLAVGSTVADASRATTDPGRPGALIGRYVTMSELGAGAMGRVYLAVDPELDRRIAIKVLRRVDASGDLDLRLRREAQALARVTHPNVATIFDVGETDGSLFLAMEYVGGGTLSAWLAARTRSWQEIVRVFAAAGRGLAAVHARGLVHRDFKPDNVLLDEHGAAKVTDFGLVSTRSEAGAGAELGSAEGVDVMGSLTVTGAVLGTPAYMSPEQLGGRAVDARSDQFSFCVALYEALYWTRPFAGATLGELRAALQQPAAVPTAEQKQRAPRWLHAVVARGLALDPARRFAVMDELVAALDFDRRRRRRWLAVAVVAGGAVLASGAWFVTRPGAATCGGADAELAATWNPDRRHALEAAFGRSRLPFARDAAAGVGAVVDGYADRWRASHLQACEATQVHRSQSSAAMDLRMACLARRRAELASLLDVLATATPEIVEHAVAAVAALPSITQCDDVSGLTGIAPLPADPAARADIEAVRAALVRAAVWTDSGMLAAAGPLIDAQVTAAERLRYAPLEAEALMARGRLEDARGDFAHSVTSYERAAASADRGRDDRTRFRAAARAIDALSGGAKLDAAEAHLPAAEAALDRVGADPELAEQWDTTRARIHYLRGRIHDAEALYRAAIARARARADQRAIGELLYALVLATTDVTDPAQILPLAEESLAIALHEDGPHHPEVARREAWLARVLSLQDKVEVALERATHAKQVLVEVYGPDHADVASVELTIGGLLRKTGRNAEARVEIEHCLKVMRATFGDQHFWVADALMNLALIERRAHELPAALAHAREAQAILATALGPNTDGLVASYHTIALILREQEQPDAAQASLEAGVALGERTAPDNPRLALFYAELGSIRLERDDARGAEPWLERAVATYAASAGSPEYLAFMRLDLAHAKASLGKWREVLDLATQARAALSDPADLGEADQLIGKASHHLGLAPPATKPAARSP